MIDHASTPDDGAVVVAAPPAGTLSVKQAASALGIHWQTVYRWIKRDAIPYLKTPGGRFRIPASWAKSQAWAQADEPVVRSPLKIE
jgi:excisionase family DNA binding protein